MLRPLLRSCLCQVQNAMSASENAPSPACSLSPPGIHVDWTHDGFIRDAPAAALAGAAAFLATGCSSQAVQSALGLSTRTRIAASAVGAATVATGTLASAVCGRLIGRATCPPDMSTNLQPNRERTALSGDRLWHRLLAPNFGRVRQEHIASTQSLNPIAITAVASPAEVQQDYGPSTIAGTCVFFATGGRLKAFSPSDLRSVGAFGRRAFSLPATLSGASAKVRACIATYGMPQGCLWGQGQGQWQGQ